MILLIVLPSRGAADPIAQKNPCTERAGVSNAEKLGTTPPNLAVWRRAVSSIRDSSANNASLGAGAPSLDRRCSLMILV